MTNMLRAKPRPCCTRGLVHCIRAHLEVHRGLEAELSDVQYGFNVGAAGGSQQREPSEELFTHEVVAPQTPRRRPVLAGTLLSVRRIQSIHDIPSAEIHRPQVLQQTAERATDVKLGTSVEDGGNSSGRRMILKRGTATIPRAGTMMMPNHLAQEPRQRASFGMAMRSPTEFVSRLLSLRARSVSPAPTTTQIGSSVSM